MDLQKAFRASQGLDAANNNVINVLDPRSGELLDGVNQGYFIQKNTVQTFVTTRPYEQGFIVERLGRLYKALVNISAGAFNKAQWEPLRTDPIWKEMSPLLPTLAFPGDHIHLNTTNSAFNVTLPASPEIGDMVIFNDRSGDAHIRPVTVSRNGNTIDGKNEDFLINIPRSTVMFFFTASNTWTSAVRYESKVSLLTASQGTQGTPYQLAAQEVVYNRTSTGKLWLRLPEFPNDRDVITLYDMDGRNSISYTQGSVHPDSTHTITTTRYGVVTSFEANYRGETKAVFDKANNTWRLYSSDLNPRITNAYANIQSEPFQYVYLSHATAATIDVTLPEKPSQGDWVDVLDLRATPTSIVNIKVHPSSVGIAIKGDIVGTIQRKYSVLPKSDAELPTSLTIQIPPVMLGVNCRLHFDGANWAISRVTFRVEHVDELNPSRPGIIPLAIQSEVNAQYYVPDGLTATVVPDKAVTPKTLDARRSTTTLAGLARLATSAEMQVVTAGTHRDDVIVTPLKLNSRQATETIRGLAEVATQTETRSLTLDTHMITPMKFHAAQAEEQLTGVAKLVTSGGTARTTRLGNGTGIYDTTNHLTIVTPLTLNQYRATEFQPGVLWIANQGEANANLEDTPSDIAYITPAKLANRTANDTRRGIVARATLAESQAITGTGERWDNVYITPYTLYNRSATETRRGVVETATQAEVDAGALDTHYHVTPLKFKTWLNYNHFSTLGTDGLRHTGTIWSTVNLTIDLATEAQRGTLEVATQIETDAGTSDIHIITPKKLDARRATPTLHGISRRSTDAEIDAATVGNAAGEPVLVTPANLLRWTRTSANSRSDTTRYGTNRNAVTSETWIGNSTVGSTQAYTAYLQDAIAVTPRGLNYALDNYLPLHATADNSQLLDGLDSLQFVRRDIDQNITGSHSYRAGKILSLYNTDNIQYWSMYGANTNDLFIRNYGVDGSVRFYSGASDIFRINTSGATQLFYNKVLTLETTSTGLTVAGTIIENELTANGASPGTGTLRSKYLGIGNNAVSASKLLTARTVTFATGDVTGSFTFDGSANVSNVNLQVVDGSHSHSGNNITSGTVNSAYTQQANHTTRGTVMLTADRTVSSQTKAASQQAIYEIDQILQTTTQNKGVYDWITFRDWIQVGSVRMSANTDGVLEFTYGNPIA